MGQNLPPFVRLSVVPLCAHATFYLNIHSVDWFFAAKHGVQSAGSIAVGPNLPFLMQEGPSRYIGT